MSSHKNQQEIPGTERDCIPELDVIIADFVVKRGDKRKAEGAHKTVKELLVAEMANRNLTHYIAFDGERQSEVNLDLNTALTVKNSTTQESVAHAEANAAEILDGDGVTVSE